MIRAALLISVCWSSMLAASNDKLECSALQLLAQDENLPDPVFAPLTPEMETILKQHPIWAKFHGTAPKIPLNFEIQIGNVPLEPGKFDRSFKGESIQGHFLAVTLKELFPQANVYCTDQTKKRIVIYIWDVASMGAWKVDLNQRIAGRRHYMDMSVLKTANGRGAGNSKEDLRRRMGIPENSTVISLYQIENASVPAKQVIQSLVAGSDISKGADAGRLFIVNSAVNPQSIPFWNSAEEQTEVFGKPLKKLALSSLSETPITESGPYLIENDTVGKMPYVTKMADIHVVAGPVNLYEGLNAGTPTVFFGYSPEWHFEPKGFNKLASLAEATGGAIQVNNASEFRDAIKVFRKKRPSIIAPYLVKVDGKNAFERYLDSLEQLLDEARDGTTP